MLAAKRLLHKAVHHHHDEQHERGLKSADLDLQIPVHYGIPSTASLLAFDPIQRLLAVATLDGRIKVIGGDAIEGLLVSTKQSPYKHLEFLQNLGLLVGVTNENDIQVWNLESRSLSCCLQWESNITAFSVISGSYFMYIGDEHGTISVVKYDGETTKLVQLPYHIFASSLTEVAGFASFDHHPIVGILSQPRSSGNRVLIAYENGLIILWDISEARVLFVGGGKDLELEDGTVDPKNEANSNTPDNMCNHLQEKEISALCWASSNGSILAVGYVDGDILFWKMPPDSSGGQPKELSNNKVVKLRLSSAERRLPVIVLHWFPICRSGNGCSGQLFIYGGDEIGSEEVLTVLTLEWSSMMETLRCTGRLELTLTGSFADMILLPSTGPTGVNANAALFVLTNPGQLHLYDDDSLSTLPSQQERKTPVCAVEFPAVVPMADPPMTISKLIASVASGNLTKMLSKIALVKNDGHVQAQAGGIKWPLTGGVPSHLSFTDHKGAEKVYIAGYQDGSIRLWDARFPILSLICFLGGEAQDIKIAGFGASVSNLDFSFFTLCLAVGNECGMVRIYDFNSSSDDGSFRFVTESKYEDFTLPQGKGPHCKAVFSLLNSPIRALQFTKSGAKLAVGFECGRVAMLDMKSVSLLFITDCLSGSSSPVASLIWIYDANILSLVKHPKHSEADIQVNPASEILFVLTKDATINIIDGDSSSMVSSHPWQPKKKSIAFSMYVVEGSSTVSGMTDENQLEVIDGDASAKNESMYNATLAGTSLHDNEHHSSVVTLIGEKSIDSFILLCCEDSLRLYSMKDVIQGHNKTICKVKHGKPCYWTSTLKKDGQVCGLVVLFPTGVIEIRSFPDLELVQENSLMSILRWKSNTNMKKIMSSSDDGQIALANGCELAIISILSGENIFRIPESFPCLHDKVLAAAAEAALSVSSNQKKKQVTKPGILGGIMKGIKGEKVDHAGDFTHIPKSNLDNLEIIFSIPPFPDSCPTATYGQEVVELNIDDIEIDEPLLPTVTTTSHEVKNIKKDKGTEREQLLGATDDMKPRLRTPEEIIAKYRKTGDALSAAAQARNKLAERGEKLDRISRRTAELQSGAEDFASMANELVKTMENRKWWQI